MKLVGLTLVVTVVIAAVWFYQQQGYLCPPRTLVGVRKDREVPVPRTKDVDAGVISGNDIGQLLLHTRGLTGKELLSLIYEVNKYENMFPLDDMLSVVENGVDTIDSTVIPLSLEQAKEMCKCFRRAKCLESSTILRDLALNITQVMKEKYNDEAFVKISTASGKDVPGEDLPQWKEEWSDYLNSPEYVNDFVKAERNISWHMNYRVCSLSNVYKNIMKVKDGFEAVRMLVNSVKVIYHLSAAVKFPPFFKKSIIIREWKKDLRADIEEFRGFVVNGKLMAVCQFSYFCYNEKLIQYRSKIESAIIQFFNQTLHPKFSKLPNYPEKYMIDFIVQNWDQEHPTVMVLEVGGISDYIGLFDRKTEWPLIERGAYPYRLKVLERLFTFKEFKHHVWGWMPFLVDGLDLSSNKTHKE